MLVPSMVFGGVSGGLVATLLNMTGVLGQLDTSVFVVAGIASALVAVIGVPLAAIALVLEVFGSPYGPPAILACGVTYVLTLRMTVYRENQTD
ncbi:MAG: CIC family chloride channel protein [Myxococcota bacterium]